MDIFVIVRCYHNTSFNLKGVFYFTLYIYERLAKYNLIIKKRQFIYMVRPNSNSVNYNPKHKSLNIW